MRIKKVKVMSDEKICLSYETKNTNGKISEYTLVSGEKATPSFYKTLQELRESVIEICELPGDKDMIKVSGVSFSFAGDNDTMGAVITAQRKLNNSNTPLNLNTPHKAVEPYGEGKAADAKQLLPDECINILNELISESEAYIEGKREQTNLFDKDKK